MSIDTRTDQPTLVVESCLTEAQTQAAWEIYYDAFAPLAIAAAARHLLTFEEFAHDMRDERITKLLAMDPLTGEVIGLGTITNQLEAIPWISAPFYAHRWPERYAQGRIFYIGFVGVHSEHRKSNTFVTIFQDLLKTVSEREGIAAMDFCKLNVDKHAMPKIFDRVARSAGLDPVTSRMDEQSYWSFDFGA